MVIPFAAGNSVNHMQTAMALTWMCPARRASHLEQDWRQDGFKKLSGGLAQHFTLVRCDRPGPDHFS